MSGEEASMRWRSVREAFGGNFSEEDRDERMRARIWWV